MVYFDQMADSVKPGFGLGHIRPVFLSLVFGLGVPTQNLRLSLAQAHTNVVHELTIGN